ncbi:MAG: hypothetical protein ACJ76Y_18680 [Thermoanaerobaculia bacterium]|jgi:TolA-binding protein
MQGSRVRLWPVLSLLALLGCNMPSSSPPPSSAGSSAEAEKTQKMEEKAAEYQRHAEEVRNMEGTEQEKIDAMNSLDQERRELNEMSESK